MRILVLGSSGFIGGHLTARLTQLGHHVTGLDTRAPEIDCGLVSFHHGDIRAKDDLLRAMAGADCVIHLAAVHADFGYADDDYWDTNDTGTQRVVQAMAELGIRHYVFTSSIAVYGERDDESDEQTSPCPTTVYGASKLAAEQTISRWANSDPSRRILILRPCVVYGERNVANMNKLIRQIHSGYFFLLGSGQNIKAIAYVGNLVEAICWGLDRLQPGIQLYNYSDEPSLTVEQIVSIIRRALGKSPDPWKLPLWTGILAATPFELASRMTGKDLRISVARVRKLAHPTRISSRRIRQLGFLQPYTPEEGLRRTVRYFLDQHFLDQQTHRSSAVC